MDSDELDHLLKNDAFSQYFYQGAVPLNHLPLPLRPMQQFIVNLDTCKCAKWLDAKWNSKWLPDVLHLSSWVFSFPFFPLSADQPGSHWCYVENLTSTSGASVVTWADPLGLPPPLLIVRKILDSNQDVCFSDIRIQSHVSKTCGNVCAVFCMLRSRGYSFHEIFYKFFLAADRQYIRNDFVSKIVVSSLMNLRDPGVIDWESILSAAGDFLNKNL